MNDLLTKALIVASKAHKGQVDLAGVSYILHPLRVMAKMDSIEDKIIAVLHDVIEDSDVTPSSLLLDGFPPEIITVVECLTRKVNESYDDYISRIKKNPTATRIKIADLADNTDVSRGVIDPVRLKKYVKAI